MEEQGKEKEGNENSGEQEKINEMSPEKKKS